MTNPEMIERGWASGLIVTGHADWPGVGAAAESTGESGLVNILVAREGGSRPWDGGSDITFGHEGKPMYVQGPYDDAAHIIRTLRRRVGDDNFHYICEISP